MTPKRDHLFSAMIGLLLLVSSPSIRALTNGVPDTGNTYSNVGAVFAVGPDGHAIQLCSGTLISPTVFLTVAHCVAYFNSFLAPEGFALYMSFANPIPFLELTDVNTLIPVTAIIPNPNYIPANDTHPLTPIHRGDPADLAVIILPAAVTQGIAPATLPTAGLLDELSAHNHLQGATFIAVGTGLRTSSSLSRIHCRGCLLSLLSAPSHPHFCNCRSILPMRMAVRVTGTLVVLSFSR